ncbi:hypothetical protein AAES_01843 [Amazona aestiva]|uniref:G-protein coupled receptors family 1 profile domain-containing protein n=1 Tax=Amazona aestiva TaxID=12930 RepID=A0A0Q3U5P3_AMAAE|nr:hypothetical protein AAES_01843 [Amazona aestiva]
MACGTGRPQKQGGADVHVDVDLYLAARLLFTVLAFVLTSIFSSLCGAEGGRSREPLAAETAWERSPGDQELSPVATEREGQAAAEPSPAAVEQWEGETAKKPSPEAEPSPAAAESIPQQLPAEPHEPKPQEDAGDHAALPNKAEEEDLDSDKEQLVVREPASTAAASAPVTSTVASFESSEGFEWPLDTLETCLLIVMGISMLACMQSVFYPQPFCLVPRVKQSGVWALSGTKLPCPETVAESGSEYTADSGAEIAAESGSETVARSGAKTASETKADSGVETVEASPQPLQELRQHEADVKLLLQQSQNLKELRKKHLKRLLALHKHLAARRNSNKGFPVCHGLQHCAICNKRKRWAGTSGESCGLQSFVWDKDRFLLPHAQRQQMSNCSSITHFLLLPFADMRELQLCHFWLFLGISLAALMGNGLIITSTACDKHLHTPIYFFLLNFSLMDMGCISTTVPKSMTNSLCDTRAISYTACAAQLFFFLFFISAEYFLLTATSYDRYVAICKPLHDGTLLGSTACVHMAAAAWGPGFVHTLLHTANTFSLPLC